MAMLLDSRHSLLPLFLFFQATLFCYTYGAGQGFYPDELASPLDVGFVSNQLGGVFPRDGDESWANLGGGFFGGVGSNSRLGNLMGAAGTSWDPSPRRGGSTSAAPTNTNPQPWQAESGYYPSQNPQSYYDSPYYDSYNDLPTGLAPVRYSPTNQPSGSGAGYGSSNAGSAGYDPSANGYGPSAIDYDDYGPSSDQYGPPVSGNGYGPSANGYGPSASAYDNYGPSFDQYGPSADQYGPTNYDKNSYGNYYPDNDNGFYPIEIPPSPPATQYPSSSGRQPSAYSPGSNGYSSPHQQQQPRGQTQPYGPLQNQPSGTTRPVGSSLFSSLDKQLGSLENQLGSLSGTQPTRTPSQPSPGSNLFSGQPQSSLWGSNPSAFQPLGNLGSASNLFSGFPATQTRPTSHPGIDSSLFAPLETQEDWERSAFGPSQSSGQPGDYVYPQGIVPVFDDDDGDQFGFSSLGGFGGSNSGSSGLQQQKPYGANNAGGSLSSAFYGNNAGDISTSYAGPGTNQGGYQDSYPSQYDDTYGNDNNLGGISKSYAATYDKQPLELNSPSLGAATGKGQNTGASSVPGYVDLPPPPVEYVYPLFQDNLGIGSQPSTQQKSPSLGAFNSNSGLNQPSKAGTTGHSTALSPKLAQSLPAPGNQYATNDYGQDLNHFGDADRSFYGQPDNGGSFSNALGSNGGQLNSYGGVGNAVVLVQTYPAQAPSHVYPSDVYGYRNELQCWPQFFLEYEHDFSGSVWQDVKGQVVIREGRALFEGQGYLAIPFFACNDLLPRYSFIFVIRPTYPSSQRPQAILGNSVVSAKASFLVSISGQTLTLVIRQRAPGRTAQQLLAESQCPGGTGGTGLGDHDDRSIVALQVAVPAGEFVVTIAQENEWIFFGAGDHSDSKPGRLPALTNEALYVGAGSDPRGGGQLEHYTGTFDSFLFEKCP